MAISRVFDIFIRFHSLRIEVTLTYAPKPSSIGHIAYTFSNSKTFHLWTRLDQPECCWLKKNKSIIYHLQRCSSKEFSLCPSIDREVISVTLSGWVLEIWQLPIVQACRIESSCLKEMDHVRGKAKLQLKTPVVDAMKKKCELVYIGEKSR